MAPKRLSPDQIPLFDPSAETPGPEPDVIDFGESDEGDRLAELGIINYTEARMRAGRESGTAALEKTVAVARELEQSVSRDRPSKPARRYGRNQDGSIDRRTLSAVGRLIADKRPYRPGE